MSDQGKEFCNNILKEMCYYLNIKKVRTMPYHPQSNGAVERVHQTLRHMIAKLDNKRRRNWPDHLSSITHTYNSTRSQIMGYSPYFLMMGRRPCLPVDLLFPTSRQLPKTRGVQEYVKALHGHLRNAFKAARISSNQEAARHKCLYGHRAGAVELHPGDKVLVRLDLYKGANRKLVNQWSSTLHTVVGWIADDVPAYVIENDKGKQQVLHRVQLLLWSSCENEQDGLQMTAAELNIFVSLSALEPLPDGEKRCRVPYEWSFIGFGLSLACYEPMLEASSLKTGLDAPVVPAEAPPQEGVGQRKDLSEEPKSTGDSDTVLLGDAPP